MRFKFQNTLRNQQLLQLVWVFSILIALNIMGQFAFFRFDLTQENRYSISESSIETIQQLDDILYVKVYLHGDLPSDFRQLSTNTKELLDELRAYNKNVRYEFVNPSENENKKERFKLYKQLAQEGIAYYNLPVETQDGFAQKTIFTGAIISYGDKKEVINLLSSNQKIPNPNEINQSIQELELNLMNGINKVTKSKLPRIVFSQGHGELDQYEVADFAYSLSKSYDVGQIEIDSKLTTLMRSVEVDSNQIKMISNYDLLIIAQPKTSFSDKEVFIIDQYLMHGGKIIWAIDKIEANMDSLQTAVNTLGMPNSLNLDEALFTYGVRINSNLILNQNCMEIGTAEGVLKPWHFFPLALPANKHLITQNLNAVSTHFVSNIDIVGSGKANKTVLLQTDKNSRIMPAPALIDLVEMIYRGPNIMLYNAPPQNLAVLLEGSFNSAYKNKLLDPRIMENTNLFDLKMESKPTQQIVLSDGNIMRNQVSESADGIMPFPLGYDRYSKKTFDNKKFLLNSVNYLMGDLNLIHLRNKQYKIRLLNKELGINHRLKWQLINTIIPVLSIILLGLVIGLLKKIKYKKV
jgi:ABC-2 type transport system permease protein